MGMATLRPTYDDPIFCITGTIYRRDFDFYNSIAVTPWPSNARRYCPGKGTLHGTSDRSLCLAPEDRLLQGKKFYEDDQEESVEHDGP